MKLEIELTPEQEASVYAQIANAVPADAPPQTYPRGASIGGVTFELLAPINPLWLPSAQDYVLGSQTGTKLSDPGHNGGRSPAGFPLNHAGVPTFRGTAYPEGDARIIEVAQMPDPAGDDQGYNGDIEYSTFDEADWREFIANQDVRHRIKGPRAVVAAAIFDAYERHKGANPNPRYMGKLKG